MDKAALIGKLGEVVGEANVLVAADAIAGHLVDWRGRYRGRAVCVVRPANTAAVSAVVRLCAQAGVAMVPQGGN
ncbi:MAG TPA: hydroxyacid dehydrogenase, partial [Candidatus Accumulibacter sp.]|nr:hydroxyacid dehydrogenase [Accumulibacter sp.]